MSIDTYLTLMSGGSIVCLVWSIRGCSTHVKSGYTRWCAYVSEFFGILMEKRGEVWRYESVYWIDYKISKKLKVLSSKYYSEYVRYLAEVVGTRLTESRLTKIRCVVDCFFYNMQYSLSQNNDMIITRDKGDFSRPLIYNGRKVNRQVSYSYTMDFFDWLHRAGYVISETGFIGGWHKDAGGVWRPSDVKQSRLIISDKVVEDFNQAVRTKADIDPVSNVIRIKDKDKRLTTKRLGTEQQKLCKMLQEYNTQSKDVDIRSGDREFDIQVVKIYNECSFNKGGRTYVVGRGSSVLEKENRQMLRFDGEPTVECDFKSLHPRLVATLVNTQIPLNHDPYEIDVQGYDSKALRIICKLIVLCIFNAKDMFSAMRAVNNELSKQTYVDADGNEVGLVSYWKKNNMTPEFLELKYLCNKLLDHNPYMKEYAFTGCGLDLQNLDSRIMDIVIEHFTFKGEFVLPVHDSVVVKESVKDEAVEVMTKAFSQVMGNSDNCVVEVR